MPAQVKLPQEHNSNSENSESSDLINPANRILQNITFFGDSAIPEGDPIYESVWQSAKLLAENKYAIVNGGGPGIMKAATDGAESVDGYTIAVYWQPKLASFFEGKNLANVTDESESASNYLMRTLGLIEKGDAYVVCKGGTGTISEFGMVWALAKLYYGCHKPVILYGEFWDDLVESIQKGMYINEKELAVLYRADTPEQLLEILQKHEGMIKQCAIPSPKEDESAFILSKREQTTIDNYNQNADEIVTSRPGKLPSAAQIDEFMSLVNPPARILDLGMGVGLDAKALSDKYTVVGVEPSERLSRISRFENPGTQVHNTTFQDAPLEPSTFKGVWARDSLHHIEGGRLDDVFSKIYDVLVEDGILYLIVREGSGEFIEKEQKTYGEIERFYHLFTAQELLSRTEKAGFKLVKLDKTKRSHNWLVGVFKK